MAIILASIEENGWVMALRGAWPESVSYSAFALDPDGTPKVNLTVHSAGFDRVGGQAVANSARVRQIVATKPLRKAYPDHAEVFEIDHGDGTRTVRLALSSQIYAGDVVAACSFAAGWHAGEGADTPVVTNHSTLAVPMPIVRSASPQWQMIEGAGSRFDLLVASHHPEHHGVELHQAVAGVKFTATDGTTTNDVWVTGLSTSTVYGDNLRCIGLDPVASGLFNGLNPGHIITTWTVYPWIGEPRTCGTFAPAEASSAARTIAAEVPIMASYDPGRTVFPRRVVYVDAATGSTTASADMVADNLAGAKAGTAAANISAALQAIYLQGTNIPGINGFTARASAATWAEIVLAPGVQTWGNTTINAGISQGLDGCVVIKGDPDDAKPRENCIWNTTASAASPPAGIFRFWLDSLTVGLGENALLLGATKYIHVNNVTMKGKPDFTSGTVLLHATTVNEGQYQLSATNSRLSSYAGTLRGNWSAAGLLRNFETWGTANAITHVTSRKVLNWESSLTTGGESFNFRSGTTDYMIWQCEGYQNNGVLFNTSTSRVVDGVNETVRLAVVASIVERSGSDTGRIVAYGSSSNSLVDCIFDGFSTVGNAINLHNDSTGKNIRHPNTVFINSWIDRLATKHDVFGTDGTKTAAWDTLYAVGYRGNVQNHRNHGSPPGHFNFEYIGLGSVANPGPYEPPFGTNTYPKYVNDLSSYGPESGGVEGAVTPGNGDYRPDAGSPALNRAGVSNLDVYLDGVTPRPAVGVAGALGSLAGAIVPELAPAMAVSVVTAGECVLSGVGPVGAVRPTVSVLVVNGSAGLVSTGGGPGEAPAANCGPSAGQVRVLRVRPD
ncbi:MAG: hypothetical protein WCZ66_00670 [Sphingomonadaceae bacterium]